VGYFFNKPKNWLFGEELSPIWSPCGATTLSITTFSIMTLSIMTFSIIVNKMRHSADDTQHKRRALLCWVSFKLTVCWVSHKSSLCSVSLCWMSLCWVSWRLFAPRLVTNTKKSFNDWHQAGLTEQPSEAYDTNFVEDVSTISTCSISPGACTIKLYKTL
jgi:hypothetical protein